MIYKSAKTGKIVTEKYAKANPDLVIKQGGKKAEPKPAPKKAAPKVEVAPIEVIVQPSHELGQIYECGNVLYEFTSLDPLQVVRHEVRNGVRVMEDADVPNGFFRLLERSEVFERLY